eukprot:7979781-Pyramimonas_sp.AAC.1
MYSSFWKAPAFREPRRAAAARSSLADELSCTDRRPQPQRAIATTPSGLLTAERALSRTIVRCLSRVLGDYEPFLDRVHWGKLREL